MTSSHFVVVANRLPVDKATDPETGEATWTPSPGGLVTALRPVLESNDGAWVGWPGSTDEVAAEDMPSAEDTGLSLVPVNLDQGDFEQFYEGFSNATLWPLYHDLIVHPTYNRAWWDRYRAVNERFTEAADSAAAEGATVWVQDYQLHLVPGQLRKRRGDVKIGFFLHIPFPSPELFRQLPWRADVLRGTLGADVVGFHTQDSARNFMLTLRALGYDVEIQDSSEAANYLRGARLPEDGHVVGTVQLTDGRVVKVGVYPISIDSLKVNATANDPAVMAQSADLRAQLGNPKVLIAGVDRLDYTKGILQRLEAVELLLDEGRLAPEDVVMVQVATPSRERLDDYQRTREKVEQVISRINGNHGGLGRSVVLYKHSGLPFEEIIALYAAADIMLITPLKDGMNLVAKEYVACHSDGSGALVLSEFAGAATQLVQAYLCNPHDVESIAAAIERALEDDPAERVDRMRQMWSHTREHDVSRWAGAFLNQMREVR
ncbi:MAG TPA: trehalose-6-phosphate synthase [Candidatus Corynebacterium gallistercoris]|uniref:alpha,alpha-trehalose-phosphate synthase (ADP-forming) n=1 Tax=Candidatus Corynebacterium gallistercoris TaxID=2838530 RepID=A0A9D1UPT7_9CORY|nr:trehalose-6-phosphate synthase [Candidatus Corynebacterium gallistercoris]